MQDSPSLPVLIERALEMLGSSDAQRVRTGYVEAVERPVTLRANALASDADTVAAALDGAGVAYERAAWYPDAFVLDSDVRERAIWKLELYRTGSVYLQSLSSMLPPLVLAPSAGEDVLDMCAAPGGKTSELAALTCNRAHLTACELHAPRAEKLAYNLDKLGVRNVNVMRCDARRLDEFFAFDRILLDAPCTGTGTYRAGDQRAAERMTDKLLAKVTKAQRALLDRALTVLKPGGTLVYSTCSILPAENDDQVVAALKRHRDCKLVPLSLANTAPSSADKNATNSSDDSAAGEDAKRFAFAESARHVITAIESGEIPTLPSRLEGTVTVCPTRLYQGFYVALIQKDGTLR